MLRSGVDCVVVLGSTVSAEDGNAWNKVKVNGVWRNGDVCGLSVPVHLRDDAFYARHRH